MAKPNELQKERLFKQLDHLLSRNAVLLNPCLVINLDKNLCLPIQSIFEQQHIIKDFGVFKELLHQYPQCLLNLADGKINPLICNNDVNLIIETNKNPKEFLHKITSKEFSQCRVEQTGKRRVSIMISRKNMSLIPLLKRQSIQYVDTPDMISYNIADNFQLFKPILDNKAPYEKTKPLKIIYQKKKSYSKEEMVRIFLSMRKNLYFPFSPEVCAKPYLGAFALFHPNIALESMKLKYCKSSYRKL
jgi:hypothetical protein